MTGKSPCGCHEASLERLSQGFAFHSTQLAILIFVSAALDSGRPAIAASPPGDVVGKARVGYQGCFACTSDVSPINAWWQCRPNSQTPSSPNICIYAWRDMRQYPRGGHTDIPNLRNRQP